MSQSNLRRQSARDRRDQRRLTGAALVPSDTSPNWAEPVKACLRRIRRWRIPSNWSVADWFDEMRSVATLAGVEAAAVFDRARGVAFEGFVRSRVLSRALTFYRREWAYAIRRVDGVSNPEDQKRVTPELFLLGPDRSSPLACANLREILGLLPDRDHWLLEELYVQERAEADIGRQLGISRRTVNKRKHTALCRLRFCIEE